MRPATSATSMQPPQDADGWPGPPPSVGCTDARSAGGAVIEAMPTFES